MESNDMVVAPTDTNDYKDLYSKLRNTVNVSRDSYKAALTQTKDAITQREDELKILKIRQHKLEGAIEAADSFLTAVLPDNNKK